MPRNRVGTVAWLCLLSVLSTASIASAAAIQITSAPRAGDYTMSVQVAEFSLAPVSSTPVNRAGEGHIHYLVNGNPAQGSYATPDRSFAFRGLVNGDTVAAELVNNDHTSLNPRVLAEQRVGGGLPGFELALLVVGVAVALSGARRGR